MKAKYIILILLFLLYLIYTINAQRKIISTINLNTKKKIVHSILIWVIPFLWYYLIKDLITIDKGPMTKRKRDKLAKQKRGGFYESGKGMYGV